ncbi:MAG: hypothetical protein ACJ8F3_02855 [Xanthobacteraceae bacterium]
MRYGYYFTILIVAPLAMIAAPLLYQVISNPEWQLAITSGMAAVVRPILIPLVILIGTPWFVYLAATALLLAAVVVCIAYWWRVVRPTIRKMRGLVFDVRALPRPDVRYPQRRSEAMKQLGAALRRCEVFRSGWADFQGQSLRAGGIPDAPFAHFAAGDPTSDQAEHRGFMQALPGYFTSVGLILTFLGLVVALYFAAKGFRSGDMTEARTAILQLLNASAFKFLTSLAALGGALLISVFSRVSWSIMRRETADAVAMIEAYISEWRDSGESSALARPPIADVSEKLDVLIGAILRLTEQIGRLQDGLGAAREREHVQ